MPVIGAMRFFERLVQGLVDVLTSARFVVHGDSMLPALTGGESVLAVRPRSQRRQLRRGDVVVMRHPVWNERTYLKRIVGLPDEEIRLENERVYIDGSLLVEKYLHEPPQVSRHYNRDWWTGPEEYFVLGDNRLDSEDSRAFGPVDRRLILGLVWFRCWPPRTWGPVQGGGGSDK